MTQIKKYLPYAIIAILAFHSFDLSKRYNALERSAQSLEESVQEEIDKNETLLKKLQAETFNVQAKERKIKELEALIPQKHYDEEIDHIPDADVIRISELFAKWYATD